MHPKDQEIDEATATALAIVIRNQIEALTVWERKLRQPFMPIVRSHLSVMPTYPKPTLTTMLHVASSGSVFGREVVRLIETIEGMA